MKVFISYRRVDTQAYAGRISDRLKSKSHFIDQAFMDVESLKLGSKVKEVLSQAVAECDVLLVLIGRKWLRVKDKSGKPRLENPNDWVRVEIVAALERDIPVIPILIGGAPMPQEEELPAPLAELADRQGLHMSHVAFDQAMLRLENELSELKPRPPANPQPPLQPWSIPLQLRVPPDPLASLPVGSLITAARPVFRVLTSAAPGHRDYERAVSEEIEKRLDQIEKAVKFEFSWAFPQTGHFDALIVMMSPEWMRRGEGQANLMYFLNEFRKNEAYVPPERRIVLVISEWVDPGKRSSILEGLTEYFISRTPGQSLVLTEKNLEEINKVADALRGMASPLWRFVHLGANI